MTAAPWTAFIVVGATYNVPLEGWARLRRRKLVELQAKAAATVQRPERVRDPIPFLIPQASRAEPAALPTEMRAIVTATM